MKYIKYFESVGNMNEDDIFEISDLFQEYQ